VHDPTDIVEQEITKAEQAKRERHERAVEVSIVQRILSSEVGRTFVWGLLERAGVYQLSIDPSATELTHRTAFAEGRRSEGLHIYSLILEHCSELWPVMVRENAQRLAAKRNNQ
jgi:hypothetical protein